jgi:hypothetical protein
MWWVYNTHIIRVNRLIKNIMNEELDIFSIGDPQTGKFFYHKEVGDSIKGTYIDIQEGVDGYDNEQYIYVLKDESGDIWKVGVNKKNTILVEEMNNKKLGDIIGLKYDEQRESKRFPGKMAKIIRVYPYRTQGPVDEAWLAEREEIEKKLGHAPKPIAENEPAKETEEAVQVDEEKPIATGVAATTETEVAVETPKEDDGAFTAIRDLALSKGLVTDKMTNEDIDKKIVEYTELPLEEENFSQIIIKLTGYTS